ncbi:MAG: ATP-binding protein [Ignavibacteriales bacterium]|nr:ATP-binding protein [Ignavibacteriales bacterium]
MNDQQTMDLRQDTTFFGRTEELYQLVRSLQRGRHALIVGDKGIGKTRLMTEAKWILSGRTKRIDFSANIITQIRGQLGVRINPNQYKILFIEHSSPLGDCMKEMTEKLFYNGDLHIDLDEERADWQTMKKHLSGFGSIKLQSIIFEGISQSDKSYLIFFDELDRISPSQQKFIETLLNIAVICTAVVQMKENFLFKRIWASFSRINLEPLPEQVSIQLINYFLQNYPLHIIDSELYRREILKASNGNPFHIKNMLWHGSREKYVDAEEIRKLRQVDEGHYFNMGPIYIFGIAMFTLFKIFSIGTDNQEFYIYFSALGFFAYLVFRVFRAFFLFRPQKY